jgi:hypothetical protein
MELWDSAQALQWEADDHPDIPNIIQKHLELSRSTQMEAIRKGFMEPAQSQNLSLAKLSTFEMMSLFYGRCHDNCSSDELRRYIVFDAEGDERLLEQLYEWLDTLGEEDLRKFLYFATLQYTLPVQIATSPACNHPTYLLEQPAIPYIFIHTSDQDLEIHRPFINHLTLPLSIGVADLSRMLKDKIQTWLQEDQPEIQE